MRPRTILQKFAAEVRERREERHLSQEELALECGVHPNVVQKLEQGKTDNRLQTLFKIAAGLNVPLSELIAGVEKRR